MRKTNENKTGEKLKIFRALRAVLSVLLVLLVGVACDTVNSGDAHNTEDNTLTETKASDDGGGNPSINPAYNTVLINGVPVYSYDGYMNLNGGNGSSRGEEITKLIKDASNKGKVYRVTISKKFIDSSADGTVKDPIEPAVLDDNDYYTFNWMDKNQNHIEEQRENHVNSSVYSEEYVYYSRGILKYLRDYSIGDIIPVSMSGQISYSSSTTSMDKYNGTYDEHEGCATFDAIIEFEITE